MRIVTLNVNGLRSAERKGFARWLARAEPWDVVCLQEIKCLEEDVPRPLKRPRGSHATFVPAVRKGYSGVALYSKRPHRPTAGFGHAEFDAEGRYLEADFGDLAVISLYLPSGSSGPERQASKFRFLEAFLPHLEALRRSGREIVLCGDWNIAHTEADIKNWKGNLKKAGFLPQERQWLSDVLATGWVDAVRQMHPGVAGPYAWWSWRGQAFDNDAGWRIDYHLVTPGLAARVVSAGTERPAAYALRWSDHAPVTVEFGMKR